MGVGKKSGTVMKPFVDIGNGPDSCWNWMGSINRTTGYGKKQWHGRTIPAHRWIWELLLGPIPGGLVINHKCSNRACVNPHHLELTTTAGNVRHGAGTKLSPDQVRRIKAAKHSRKWGDGIRLAKSLNVSGALIHDIWNGRAWVDMDG